MRKAFLTTTLATALFAGLLVGCETGGDYDALQEEVVGLRTDYDALRTDYDALRGEHDTFRGEYDTFYGDYTTFREGLGEPVELGD